QRNLADTSGSMLFEIEQLAVLGDLAAPEDGPRGMFARGLRNVSVARVALRGFSPPGEVPGEFPAWSKFAGIKSACRPALLVDARLKLLRIFKVAPTTLQSDLGRRVPGNASGG